MTLYVGELKKSTEKYRINKSLISGIYAKINSIYVLGKLMKKFLFQNLAKLRNCLGITLVEHVEQTINKKYF